MSVVVRNERCPLIRFYCPEWFARKDFADFVLRYANPGPRDDGGRLATWHRGEVLHENSDVFVLVDGGETSECGYLPAEIDEFLCNAMRELGLDYAMAWLVNFDPS